MEEIKGLSWADYYKNRTLDEIMEDNYDGEWTNGVFSLDSEYVDEKNANIDNIGTKDNEKVIEKE